MANVKSMNGLQRIDSHGDRPAARAALPFRRFRDSVNGHVCLEYFRGLPNGYKQPFVVVIDDDCNPLGRNISSLIDMYFALEEQVDGLKAENDELKVKIATIEGDKKSLEGKVHGLKGRLDGEKGGGK